MYHNPRLRRPQINFNTRKLRTQYLNYRTNNSISKRTRIGRGTKNVRKRFSKKNNLKFRQFGGGDRCTICLEDDFSTNPNNWVKWVKLPCNHDFHLSCIIRWIEEQGQNSTCPMCRVGLDEDLYEALVDRQIDLDTALGQNNVPLVIRFPLRLPEANQRVNQSASFQRLPPRPNRETMSFNELRTMERRPRTFLSRPPVIQQPRILVHPPTRLIDISNPTDWASLARPSILYPGRRRRVPPTSVTVNI